MQEKNFRFILSIPKPEFRDAPYNPENRDLYEVDVIDSMFARAFGQACIQLEDTLEIPRGPSSRIRCEAYTHDLEVDLMAQYISQRDARHSHSYTEYYHG